MARREVLGDSARDGDVAIVRLVVDGQRIVDADAPGIDRPLVGLTLLEAAAVPGRQLACDALANAIAQCFVAAPDPERVAVAMSGGVDSAVALLRAAPNAVGITLRLWLDPLGPSSERACCSPAAVVAARETCHRLGIPHLTLDLRERFREVVVADFVAGYAAGRTPNPCTRCNGSFRFDALVDAARRVGAAVLWTGHYARIEERGGLRLVARAVDREKDQSYMLATVSPALLERVAFPLGESTKAEVRAEAAAGGLEAATRPESQEACFLAGGDYRLFLERHGLDPSPGPIVDEKGAILGHHEGTWRYTPGQRRGIGVAASRPLYALRADTSTNALVVGPRSSLAVRHVDVEGRQHVPTTRARVKLRSRSEPSWATVSEAPSGFELTLDDPVEGVAIGQTAVLYDDDVVTGAGLITRASG
jgi:tRNA-uridine 2-sulfurtransferase